MSFVTSYQNLDISVPKYILRVIAPSVFIGLLLSFVLAFMLPYIFLETFFVFILYLIPLFTTTIAIFYPPVKEEIRSVKIDKDLHLFITRLGALSASEMSDRGFRDIFAEMEMYGELGKEIERLEKLVNNWNMSLSEAARVISKNTPSELLSDFLERLAYALETQTSPKEFFKDEQETVMDDYSNEFEEMLFRLDVLRELYVASVTICIFGMVLAVITPLVMDIEGNVFIPLSFLLFVVVSFISAWAFFKVIPRTRIWYKGDIKSDVYRKLDNLFVGGLLLSGAIAIFFLFFDGLPLLLKIAIISTPLIVPGFFASIEENWIKRRDSNFPSFIRSLAGNTPAQTSDHKESVGKLRYHDLGKLTDNIRDLYRRLRMNIDSEKSWRHFGSETGSFLINEFSNIFLKASQHGAHPEQTSPVISENFIEVKGLRNKKILRAKSLQSVFYLVIIVLTLTMVTVFMIVEEINSIIARVDMPVDVSGGLGELGFIRAAPIDLATYSNFILIMILTQALISCVVCWHVKGEHKYISVAKFSIMMWLSVVCFYIARLGVMIIF